MLWFKRLAVVGAVLLLVLIAVNLWARSKLPDRRDPEMVAAELEADIAAVEAMDWPRPPLFDEPAEGTAWDHYLLAVDPILDAGRLLPEADLFEAGEVLDGFDDPDTAIPDSLKALLKSAEPGWEEVRRGTCARLAGRALTPRDGFTNENESDELYYFAQHLGTIALARAALLVRTEPRRAVETLMVIHRFGEDFHRGGPAIAYLVGNTLSADALDMAGRLVIRELMPEAEVDRVLEWLDSLPARQIDPMAVAGAEMLHLLRYLEQVGKRESGPDDFDLPTSIAWNRRELLYRVLDLHREAYARARDAVGDQGVAAVGEEVRRNLRTWLPWLVPAAEFRVALLVRAFSGWSSLAFEKIDEAPRRLRAKQTAIMLLIHAARFNAREGRNPVTLEEIVAFAGGEFPGIDLIVYRPFPETGEPAFYWQPDIDAMEDGDAPAEPLARTYQD